MELVFHYYISAFYLEDNFSNFVQYFLRFSLTKVFFSQIKKPINFFILVPIFYVKLGFSNNKALSYLQEMSINLYIGNTLSVQALASIISASLNPLIPNRTKVFHRNSASK